MISSFSLFSFQGALSHGQFHCSQAFRKFRPAKPLRLPSSVCRGFHLLFSCELPRDVYASIMLALVGLSGLEPPTSRLSGVRSNRLSYKPISIWQPPAFPYRHQYSIIGRFRLNHRVRDVDGCFPKAHRHRKFEHLARYFRA